MERWNCENVRHQSSSKSLEEEGHRGRHGGEVATETAAQRKKARDEGNGSEEQCDQVEGKHEARQVVVHVRANELLGDILLRAKVSRWVKWQRRHNLATIGVISRRVAPADGEEGPSRGIPRVGNAAGRCLEEVEAVDGAAVDGSAQNGEELEEDTASEQDERGDGEDGSCAGQCLLAQVGETGRDALAGPAMVAAMRGRGRGY